MYQSKRKQKVMQQDTVQPEHSEEALTFENRAPETSEPLPYGRRETVFTMIGVLSLVSFSLCLTREERSNSSPFSNAVSMEF